MTRHEAVLLCVWICLATACGSGTSPPSPSNQMPVRLFDVRMDQEGIPFTIGTETRLSLPVQVPSTTLFEVTVPERGVLELSTAAGVAGAGEEGVLPARIEFRIELSAGDERETVFTHRIRRFEPNAWFDHDVDLTRWEGEQVELALAVEALPLRGAGTPPPALDVVALWSNPVLFSRGAARGRPDVFLVSIDCLRSDHVGTYGYERDTTPTIDRFAATGVVFETVVASAPETLPSHMSMLTGLTPALHGASKRSKLPASVPYLPELFADAGYEVHGIVTGGFLSQPFGFERGFHSYRYVDVPRSEAPVDAAIELLRHGRGRSQFLWLHLFEPHWPYLPESELLEKFGPRPSDITALMGTVANQDVAPAGPEAIQEVINLYDAEIFATDRALGRYFEELRARGRFDPALVIVVADHGEAFYEHQLWQHTLSLYEEMIRIPLVVKWPGSSPAGRSQAVVHQVDVFTTMLEAAGIVPPPHEGRNLNELLEPASSGARQLWSEAGWTSAGRNFRILSARDDELKYILSLEDAEAEGWPPERLSREELYRWRKDPGEREELTQANEAGRAPFRRDLREYLREAEARRLEAPEVTIELDETTLEQLRALGYLK